jgi:hypothetical protein
MKRAVIIAYCIRMWVVRSYVAWFWHSSILDTLVCVDQAMPIIIAL